MQTWTKRSFEGRGNPRAVGSRENSGADCIRAAKEVGPWTLAVAFSASLTGIVLAVAGTAIPTTTRTRSNTTAAGAAILVVIRVRLAALFNSPVFLSRRGLTELTLALSA